MTGQTAWSYRLDRLVSILAVNKLEGIDGHKNKILELLSPSLGDELRLRVVSIVGCRGVGKTALARAVYKECIAAADAFQFHCVAWVNASGCNDKKSLLNKISQRVQAAIASRVAGVAEADADSATALQDMMSTKRYASQCIFMVYCSWLLTTVYHVFIIG